MAQSKSIITIGVEDFKKYGCVECNCEFAYNSGVGSSGECSMLTCGECETEFVIMADNIKQSNSHGFFAYGKNKFNYAVIKGDYAYPIKEEHPHKILKHAFERKDVRPENGEYFSPRGVGYDLAGFVKSKQAGERLVEMFNSLVSENAEQGKYCFVTGTKPAWLDYRANEPLWIQVKIGYSPSSKTNIEALYILSDKAQAITKEMIEIAKDNKRAKQIVEKYNAEQTKISQLNNNNISK